MKIKHRHRGSILIYGLIALFVISFAGGLIFTYKSAIQRAERAEQRALEEERLKNQAISTLTLERELQATKEARLRLEFDQQRLAEENAVRRSNEANAERIATTMERDAEKYTGFVERVMAKNFEVINCKSDYRKMRDEDNPCIGHVR